MKFFLCHREYVPFRGQTTQGVVPFSVNVDPTYISTGPGPYNLSSGINSNVNEICDKLRQRLQALQTDATRAILLTCEIRSSTVDGIASLGIKSGPVTSALAQLLGQNFTIQLSVTDLRFEDFGDVGIGIGSIKSSEMKFGRTGDYIFKDEMLFTWEDEIWEFMYSNNLHGFLTITVICHSRLLSYMTMLEEGIGSDVVIIPANGKEVKAHKCVLMTHSSVFKVMFQCDVMKETKTHILEMRDMSEEGVRGLLAYLYHGETIEPNSKAVVALEMMYAGRKYDIAKLEAEMKELLLTKPDKWYDVDVAVKLFLVGRNLLVDGECLKMKAIQVMKGNFGSFKKSPTYVALFKEDPEVAMEFCEYFAA